MPAPKRGQSIERTDKHEQFMKSLAGYHERRGTTLESEPKVGVRHIDLFKLYQRVVEEGGYDHVSDTKAKPLMWRKLAEEFIGKNPYTAAQAFQIKNVYYKNLCAYEISDHWKKEPPPKEILEDVTAKGGNVMTRTLENFERPRPREQDHLHNGDASDASPEQRTPKDDKMDLGEEPGSATGRSTRGLRQQPPQRVLFQPELTSGRRAGGQNPASSHAPPTPQTGINGVTNASSLGNAASSTLASYEPSQTYPLSLKAVMTPANNPEFYRIDRKRKLESNAGPLAKKYKNIMLPGTGFIGPNIYVRAQLALQSGILDEERYALHHLVKISHERGDKYRFDQFPGLADALTKKVLQVSSLFYDIDWDVMYDEEYFAGDDETLNGLDGTPDIIQRVKSHVPIVSSDTVLDANFISQLDRITEAGVVIRNMSLQDENAAYIARLPLMRDLIAIVLHLPDHPFVVELKHYILDISEMMLKFLDISSQDAVYQGLLMQINSSDRGAIATAFRTIARIAMTHSAPKRLDDIPTVILQRVQEYLYIDDEELRSACLDFLGTYTSFSDNVENLIRAIDVEALARQLSRLVLYTGKELKEARKHKLKEAEEGPIPVARLSKVVVETLLKMEEPERSSEWLRICFAADANAEMTQISLWQAYQGTFGPYQATHPHLIAGDFIKNVSNTFPGAAAQVAGSNKYVIRGIKARKVPIDTGILVGSKATDKGRELYKCRWLKTVQVDSSRNPITGLSHVATTREVDCAEWFRTADDMLQHVLHSHLQLPRKATETPDNDEMDVDPDQSRSSSTPLNGVVNGREQRGRIDFVSADKTVYRCRWNNCQKRSTEFEAGSVPRTLLFARHIETHLPESEFFRTRHNLKPDDTAAQQTMDYMRVTMLEDEKGDATGVPLRAILVLRNIARFMPKRLEANNDTSVIKSGQKQEPDKIDIAESIFDDKVRERLFHAMSHSKTMRDYVGAVFRQAGLR